MADTWAGSWGSSWGLSWGLSVTPPATPTDTGGSGNRRRNINDDPDAFAEFFTEHRAKASPYVEPPAPVIIGPDPFTELLAAQEALQAAMEAREDQLALLTLQRRIEEQERAYEGFLEEEDEEILLLM